MNSGAENKFMVLSFTAYFIVYRNTENYDEI
jgi:hypothetical protein